MFPLELIKHQLSPSLRHVIIHVTNNCNFRCRHCFIDFSPKRDLKLETYQKLAKDLGPTYWIDFAGGEPFLRKDIVEIVTAFQAQIMTIPTNGFFVEKTYDRVSEIRKKTKAELTIAISIDGLKDVHDNIREKGSWDRLWETFRALRTIKGVRVKINSVICKQNFKDIIPLMEEVYSHKPDFHSMILLRGNRIDPSVELPPLDQLRSIAPQIFEILGRYDYGIKNLKSRILRNYHRYLWETSLKTIEQRTQVVPCLAGLSHGVVYANGDVSSCEMLPPVGNILNKSWDEIWNGSAKAEQRKDITEKKCHCTHNCAFITSILFRPQSFGKLLTGVSLSENPSPPQQEIPAT